MVLVRSWGRRHHFLFLKVAAALVLPEKTQPARHDCQDLIHKRQKQKKIDNSAFILNSKYSRIPNRELRMLEFTDLNFVCQLEDIVLEKYVWLKGDKNRLAASFASFFRNPWPIHCSTHCCLYIYRFFDVILLMVCPLDQTRSVPRGSKGQTTEQVDQCPSKKRRW